MSERYAPRLTLLAEATFLAGQGLTDDQIMWQQGYSVRPSWMRSLARAGLPKWDGPGLCPDLRTRLFGFETVRNRPAGHGTEGSYRRGCKCRPCKSAHAAAAEERRHQRYLVGPPASALHGRPTTYQSWGCRCPACCVAWSEKCQDYYLRRKQRATAS